MKLTLRAAKRVVRTGEAAHLSGEIPGPRNDDVVVVLQVKQGEGWLAFRRYRTRGGGRFAASYLFRRTTQPTIYEFRAQVRESGGYPYLEGDSDPVHLRVLPKQAAAGSRCRAVRQRAKGARAKRRAWRRCQRALARKRCAKARRAARRHPQAKRPRRRARRACVRYHRLRGGKRRSASRRNGKAQRHRQGRGR